MEGASASIMEQFWFTSTLFDVDPEEDQETNPGIYGKALAFWLKKKLIAAGRPVEDVIPEDWGWCVLCSRKPFMLWIGCGSMFADDSAGEDDLPPRKENLVWTCFVQAEVPVLKKLFKKIVTTDQVNALASDLKSILESDSGIKMVDEP